MYKEIFRVKTKYRSKYICASFIPSVFMEIGFYLIVHSRIIGSCSYNQRITYVSV